MAVRLSPSLWSLVQCPALSASTEEHLVLPGGRSGLNCEPGQQHIFETGKIPSLISRPRGPLRSARTSCERPSLDGEHGLQHSLFFIPAPLSSTAWELQNCQASSLGKIQLGISDDPTDLELINQIWHQNKILSTWSQDSTHSLIESPCWRHDGDLSSYDQLISELRQQLAREWLHQICCCWDGCARDLFD